MTIDVAALGSQYTNWSAAEGATAGNGGALEISYEDSILTFTEADGDSYQVNAADLTDADLEALAKEVGGTIKGADETEGAAATTEDAELEANKEKKAELQAQWDALNSSAETIKETVEKLSEEIKTSLDEAIEAQKEITEEEQERVKELVSTQIEQFKKDKEAGKDVKMSDLQANIKAGLAEGGFDEEMSTILSDLVVTNTKMVTMDSLLSELGVINGQMKMLDTEMANLDKVIEEQEKAAAEAAANCNPCDPIGFKDEDGTTYEFVVDKDGNGELSNFSEFLGSENFFDEMVALDEDGSGDVTNDELNQAGVMVLVKDANGNQELKSIEEAFGGEDVNVNLGSYQEAGEGAVAENGQTLLGNFDISVGDETFDGYSTLDSAEYLQENYTFTDENPNNLTANGAIAAEDAENVEGDAERAQITEDIDTFIAEYEAKLEEYEAQFESLTELMGLDEELIATIHEFAETQGVAAAQSIIKETEAQQAEENEAVEAEDEQAAVEGAEGAENEEADDEEKEEKEAA